MEKMHRNLVAVTGSSEPYIFDLPKILSLPDGFEFRFRYFVDWVHDSVKEQVSNEKERRNLAGQFVDIVFHSIESKRLIPLRQCTIIDIERLGPLYYLRFKVGQFAPVSCEVIDSRARESAREREVEWLHQWGTEILGAETLDLGEGLPKGMYLTRSEIDNNNWVIERPGGVYKNPDKRWAALVALLMMESQLSPVPMFYLGGIVNRKGKWIQPQNMQNSFSTGKKSGEGFELLKGSRYRLRLIQWLREEKEVGKRPAQTVACEVDESIIHLEGESNLVVGKYDILEYSLCAYNVGYGELCLRASSRVDSRLTVGSSDSSSLDSWPRVYYSARVPIKVRNSRIRLLGTCVLALVGLGLFLGPSLVISHLPKVATWLTPIGIDAIKFMGILLVFISIGDFAGRFMRFSGQVKGFLPPAGNVV